MTIKRIVVAPVLLLISVIVVSCAGSATGGPPPADRVLNLSFLQDPGQPPDPDVFYSDQGLMLTTNIYEGLLTFAADTDVPTLEGLLATEWTASPDNRVFTFTLRQGVTFHDGTPFTSAAVAASFQRRLDVNQGPSYMVADVASVEAQGDFQVTVTLNAPNEAFLDYVASPYGPRMLSPTGLAEFGGDDFAQTYLLTNDLGTGPYTLTEAVTGVRYELGAYDGYWGDAPHFTTVRFPVISDTSAQQLQFNSGELAAIVSGVPTSAVASYLENPAFSTYSLPTMESAMMYVNPNKGFLTDQAARSELIRSIDTDFLTRQTYFGRGVPAGQVYPPRMIAPELARQDVDFDPNPLRQRMSGTAVADRAITIGYSAGQADMQLLANLAATQLQEVGIVAQIVAYPTAQVFGWIGSDGMDAPNILFALAWPDAPSPYTWGHITFDPAGGLNYLSCDASDASALMDQALPSGDPQLYSAGAELALASGCWLNVTDVNDFAVAQRWLGGVNEAQRVTQPASLYLADLYVIDGAQ